eukprot:5480442-Amphidinium_carterae.1
MSRTLILHVTMCCQTHALLLAASEFGMPQSRRRSYIVACLKCSTLFKLEDGWRALFDAALLDCCRVPPDF